MRNKIINLLGFTIIFVIVRKSATNKCYDAKICVHNGEEKCGKDEDGKPRRFIDSCDMKEYNCLNEANFKKVDPEICENLPPIEEQTAGHDNKTDVSNEEKGSEEKGKSENMKTKSTVEENDDDDDHQSENVNRTIPMIQAGKAAVIKEYWCWRARYCRTDTSTVCGRDRRLNKKRKFSSACDLYKYNCDFEHDFTVTDVKFCRRY